MDVFEFALKMERDGRDYYIELAGKSENTELRGVFEGLADDELKHIEVIQNLRENRESGFVETNVLDTARNVFQKLAVRIPEMRFAEETPDMYRHALRIEEESAAFYRSKAGEAEVPEVSETLRRIGAEEEKHALIITNLIEMVERPNQWLETQEFVHLDEY